MQELFENIAISSFYRSLCVQKTALRFVQNQQIVFFALSVHIEFIYLVYADSVPKECFHEYFTRPDSQEPRGLLG